MERYKFHYGILTNTLRAAFPQYDICQRFEICALKRNRNRYSEKLAFEPKATLSKRNTMNPFRIIWSMIKSLGKRGREWAIANVNVPDQEGFGRKDDVFTL